MQPSGCRATPDPRIPRRAWRVGEAAAAGHARDERTARELLDDGDGLVRAAALAALVRMARATPADARRAVTDPDPLVRRRAADLAPGLPGADYVLLLADDDPLVVEAACFALGEVALPRPDERGRAVEALTRVATSHADSRCRESAVAALGAVGDPAGLAAILRALEDRPAVRRRAVLALAAFDGPEVDEALRRALGDRDLQVRQAAEDLLSEDATGD